MRSDVWAIGVILYELLAGESPFDANTIPELVLKIEASDVVPLRSRRPDIPRALEAVIMKCLARERADRHQTVAELATALLPYAPPRARASVERIEAILAGAGFVAPPSGAPPVARAATGGARRLVAGGVLGALVVTATVVVLKGRASVSSGTTKAPRSVPVPSLEHHEAPSVPSAAAAPTPSIVTPAEAKPSSRRVARGTPASSGAVGSHPPAAATAVVAPASAGSAVASPNCKQKFVLDAQGHKHFKPECFGTGAP